MNIAALFQRMKAVLAAMALLVPLAAAPALAEQHADPEISSFMLDNGMEVVVIPDRRAPVVTHMVWYKVGSADEDPGRSGLAHYLEHMMFKGTPTHPEGEFSQRIASVGGRENAFTSYDYTGYFQKVAPGELAAMMEFEADRMRNLVLEEEAFEVERGVIIEERSQVVESRPQSILGEELNATMFQNHRYGVPIIGWMQEIEGLEREWLVEFYDRFYAPNNAVLIVAGDVDEAEVRDLAEATYGRIEANPEISEERVRPVEPEQSADRTVTLRDERVSVPSYGKRWLVPSYNTAEPGLSEALDVLSEVLGGGILSRLHQQLVVEQGIAASAGAFYRGTSLDDTVFGVYGTPRGDAELDQVEQAIDAEITRIVEEGIEEDELERAKNRFMRSMIFARDNQATMARIYGAILTTGGTVEDITQWSERIEAVSAEAVQDAARQYLHDRPTVRSYLLPQEDDN